MQKGINLYDDLKMLILTATRHLINSHFSPNQTSIRENDIKEFLAQIEQLTLELKQEEDAFVIKEQKLIQELSKFEVSFILYLRTILCGYMKGRVYFMPFSQ